MKKTLATAAFAAAALLLAGCGSTGGTPTAGAGATVATTPTMVSPESSVPAEPTSPDMTTSEETTSEESTTEEMTTEETTSEESSSEGTTLGQGATGIDEQTTVWFDTYCTAMAPVLDLQNLGSELDTSDLEGTFKTLSEAMNKLGAAFTDASAKLKDAPPPTFDGGPEFASKILTAFEELGPKFTALGEEFAKADPSDPASMQNLQTLGQDLQSAAEPMQEFANMKVTPEVQMAIMQIPSCAKMTG
jgi:predicted small secreted protein